MAYNTYVAFSKDISLNFKMGKSECNFLCLILRDSNGSGAAECVLRKLQFGNAPDLQH